MYLFTRDAINYNISAFNNNFLGVLRPNTVKNDPGEALRQSSERFLVKFATCREQSSDISHAYFPYFRF